MDNPSAPKLPTYAEAIAQPNYRPPNDDATIIPPYPVQPSVHFPMPQESFQPTPNQYIPPPAGPTTIHLITEIPPNQRPQKRRMWRGIPWLVVIGIIIVGAIIRTMVHYNRY